MTPLIKNYSFFILIFFFTTSILANTTWELNKEEAGVQVYVRDTPGSALKSFKGVLVIPARMSSIVTVLEDTGVYPRLFHNCKSGRLLKRVNEQESYKYIVTDMPWPAKDRDTVVHSFLKQDSKTKNVEITLNAAPQYYDLKPGLVRISKMKGRWLLMPDKKGTKVVYEMSVDPGGNLPKWLVNTLAVDIPFYTLNNLKALVAQARYKNAKHPIVID